MLSNLKRSLRRKNRVASQIKSSAKRPRLSVFRSNKYVYVQLIDDESGKTVASFDDKKITVAKSKNKTTKTVSSQNVGKLIGEEILKKGYKDIVFDRNGYRYHGRVKAVAVGLREAGLNF